MDAISIRGLTKKFKKRTIKREYTTLKSELVNWILRKRKADDSHYIEVLKGIDLSIPKGKTVGIIGRNGSGKSTLLKLINGIYGPTGGTIEVDGRISALLELGAGFHPDFSGRENIIINGIILGMARNEIRARMEEIIAFSELGDFIDEPVRTYSSGMYMRLAFAVATHVDPDILVIDEILAVGDEHFGRKSMAKMNDFKARGKTIVLVTHGLGTVETWCDMAVWIDGGKVRDMGDPRKVVAHYRKVVAAEEAAAAEAGKTVVEEKQPRTGPRATLGRRWGNFDLELSSVKLAVAKGAGEITSVRPEQGIRVTLGYERFRELEETIFHVLLHRADGYELWRTELRANALPQKGSVELVIDELPVSDGEYRLEIGARLAATNEVLDCHRELHTFHVKGNDPSSGLLRLSHRWSSDAEIEAPRNVVSLRS